MAHFINTLLTFRLLVFLFNYQQCTIKDLTPKLSVLYYFKQTHGSTITLNKSSWLTPRFLMDRLRNKVRELGYLSNGSFAGSIAKIPSKALVDLIDELLSKIFTWFNAVLSEISSPKKGMQNEQTN